MVQAKRKEYLSRQSLFQEGGEKPEVSHIEQVKELLGRLQSSDRDFVRYTEKFDSRVRSVFVYRCGACDTASFGFE